MSGHQPFYRSPDEMAGLLSAAGFTVIVNEVSAVNPELVWVVGQVKKDATCAVHATH
jgi:hypothetical protein